MSIDQRPSIISLLPKKNKKLALLENWRPVSLLNIDYKIATKATAIRLEKVLPHIIGRSQTGYVKGRFIGENIKNNNNNNKNFIQYSDGRLQEVCIKGNCRKRAQ